MEMTNQIYTDAEPYRHTLNEIGVRCCTDKSTITHCYLGNYAKYFESWRNNEFTLLEIGVAEGGSIKMWREYFPKAKVYGIDINPDCAGDGIFIGSQNDPYFMASVLDKIGAPDVIIDDGSHIGIDMINTFKLLFRIVREGGYYIIEDTHCFYNLHYSEHSGVFEYFTGLAKDVDVAGRAMTGNTEYAINHGMTDPPVPEFSRYLKAMHIHPSLWIFERK